MTWGSRTAIMALADPVIEANRSMSSNVRRAVLRRLASEGADTRFAEAYFVQPMATELGCHRMRYWKLCGALSAMDLLT